MLKRITTVVLVLLLLIQFCGFTYALTPDDLVIPEQAERIVYGKSGAGRDLCAYKFGTGNHVLILGFCIHGFEDSFNRDGATLVYTAGQVMQMLGKNIGLLNRGGWTVYVLPCMNPDGLLDGTTCNGPGRCTTTSLNASGNLRNVGVDLNRCFPYNWRPLVTSRNYNGTAPLAALEAKALYNFIREKKSDGINILIDTHGWDQQIITSTGKSSVLCTTFSKSFTMNSIDANTRGSGYLSGYAASIGYQSCLFEFPRGIKSMESFKTSGYCEKYVQCIYDLIDTYARLYPANPYPSGAFDDIPVNAWYRTAVDYVVEKSLFYGTEDRIFSPELPMSRAMLLTVLWRMSGSPPEPATVPFVDVTPGSWYETAVRWSVQKGVAAGVDETHFAPDRNLTRQELVEILYLYAFLTGKDTTERTSLIGFVDGGSVSGFTAETLRWAVIKRIICGVLQGDDFYLNILDGASRAQVAAVLQRFSKVEDATEPPTTEPPTTEPPTTEPPTTEPPTTEAPTMESPATEAPTMEPLTTEPIAPEQ